MNNQLTKEENQRLKKLMKEGFVPEDQADHEHVYEIGTPFASETMALWWAWNEKTKEYKLIGFRTYKLEE